MNRETLKGCGCVAGLMAAVGLLGVGGVLAISAVITFLGWPMALALAGAIAALGAAMVFFALRFITRSLHQAKLNKPLAPYRTRLTEIDVLMKDVNTRMERVAGEGAASADLRGKVTELGRKKDEVIRALVEIDAFLKGGNDERRLSFESTYLKVRARMASSTLKPELNENAARVREIQDSVRKIKADRDSLIANLDRIAIGLRQMRARLLMPDVTPASAAKEIEDELESLGRSLDIVEKTRKEIADLEAGVPPNTVQGRVVPPKVTS